MTDRFDDPEFETFRADLPTRRPMGENTRMLIVGVVVGVLSTILAYVWLRPHAPSPAAAARAGFYQGLARDFAKAAR